jgi:hypothetical protein
MKTKLFGVVAVAGILSLGALTAYAQDEQAIAKVPFPFVVNGTLLPAGSYQVILDGADQNQVMLYSKSGTVGFPVLAAVGTTVSTRNHATFKFEKVDGYYFLSGVTVPGEYNRTVVLSPRTMTREAARLEAAADHAAGGTH